jgi:hypothetical protein
MNGAVAIKPPSLDLRFDQGVPVLVLHETADIEGLRSSIRASMPAHAAAIGGRAARLELGSREVNLFDLRRIIHMLKQEHGVEITGLYLRLEAIHRFAERELKLKLFPNDEVEPEEESTEEIALGVPSGTTAPPEEALEPNDGPGVVPLRAPVQDNGVHLAGLPGPTGPAALGRVSLPHDLRADDLAEFAKGAPVLAPPPPPPAHEPWPEGTPAPTGSQHMGPGHGVLSSASLEEGPVPGRSQTVHRTLRSGAVARFDGDLYVFGDVNPGAHVIATGNITVLGALKGVAHAGAAGDESCFIMAFDLRPTQLRIGRKIAVPPPRPPGAPVLTEQAWVEDNQIVIAPYSGGGARQPPQSRTRQ